MITIILVLAVLGFVAFRRKQKRDQAENHAKEVAGMISSQWQQPPDRDCPTCRGAGYTMPNPHQMMTCQCTVRR